MICNEEEMVAMILGAFLCPREYRDRLRKGRR